MSFSHVFAKRPLIDFLDVLRRDQTFRMILLAHPLSFLPLHLYLTTTVRHGMVYCCCASFLNILLEDIYYNGPENDLASTAGDQNTEEIQNIPSEVAPTIPTTQATGTAEPPPPTTVAVGILPTLDNASAVAAPTTVPQTSDILPLSGRPQRRTNQTRFNLDELRKCTCDVNAEVHPDGGVIQCKNTTCVTKWVRDCFYFILHGINYH